MRASRVWHVRGEALRRVLDEHPHIGLSVTKQIGNRLERIEIRVESLVFRNLRSRVVHILCELAEDFGREDEGGIVIDVPLSQQDVAMLVGATRQSVNRYLRELRAAKFVAARGRRSRYPISLRCGARPASRIPSAETLRSSWAASRPRRASSSHGLRAPRCGSATHRDPGDRRVPSRV